MSVLDDDQLIKIAMAGAFLTSYCAARGLTEAVEAAVAFVEDITGAIKSIPKDPMGDLLKSLGVSK